jgi:hypothetical protein
MNRERAKELFPIIKAYAEGKDIQFRLDDDGWHDVVESLALTFPAEDYEYRIKPEPREYFILQNRGDALDVKIRLAGTMADLKAKYHPQYDVIHVKEVLD